jgi:hypothetical protein
MAPDSAEAGAGQGLDDELLGRGDSSELAARELSQLSEGRGRGVTHFDAVCRHDGGGAQGGEQSRLGGWKEALVEGQDGISGVGGAARRRHESHVAGHVQGDEPTHRR